MATFKLFHEFGNQLGLGGHNLNTSTFRVALCPAASAPVQATGAVLADITQIAAGNGYTTVADGVGATVAMAWAETGAGTGIWQWGTSSSDVTFTASGGSITTFRYAVIVDDTSSSNKLVGFLDYGSDVTVTVGNTFTIDSGASGFFQFTIP
jgi:hypothetical protein